MGLFDRFKRRPVQSQPNHTSGNASGGVPVFAFKPTQEQLGDSLTYWDWLIGVDQYEVVLANAWGDLFLIDHDKTNTWFLSTEHGTLEDLSVHPDELREALQSREAKEVLLRVESAMLSQLDVPGAGVGPLQPGYVLSLSIPLVLGGQMDLSNIEPVQIATHLLFQGQIHRQLQNVAKGTVIRDVECDPDTREVRLVFE